MVFSLDEEMYRIGLRYEVLIECINMEVAHYSALLDEAGDDTEQGRVFFNAIKALVDLSNSVNPRDENTITRARRALDAMKIERKQNDIQTQPMTFAQNAQNIRQSGRIPEPVAIAG